MRAQIGRVSRGLSPPGLLSVYVDWLAHVALSPGKQYDLLRKMGRKAVRFGLYAGRSALGQDVPPAIEPLPQDHRFDDPAWQRWPFNLYYQSFLFAQQWLYNATTGVRGVSRHDEQVVTFASRQLLDFLAPTNFVCTNPEVLQSDGRAKREKLRSRDAEFPRGSATKNRASETGGNRGISAVAKRWRLPRAK